jgi:Tfp pilus assembly protein PilF
MAAIGIHSFSQTATNSGDAIRILELQGDVEIAHGDSSAAWTPAHASDVLHPSDRLRTGENSRVALRWSDQSIVPFGASTELEVLPPNSSDDQCGLQLAHGILSFFHRDKPGHIRIVTHGAVAGVEGTEFLLAADDTGAATLSVVDGKVKWSNDQGTVELSNGEQATVAPGQAPQRTAGFIANNLLQWSFYYPAVIDPDELQLTTDEQNALADSLSAYRSGDLLAALAQYPADRTGVSDRELIYHAALLLSVGEVEKSQNLLSSISDKSGRSQQLATALRELIAAVKRQAGPPETKPALASELLAGSYLEQSHAIRETSLQNALRLAKQATTISPKFGFAWERTAELEFSFGHTRDALRDLDASLVLSPRNAQALALKGFVLAADNKPREARDWFDRAIAADSALGNAWLGRGLVRIHLGDKFGGREDLLVAAALEPQRAELRSYLGKTYINSGDDLRATKELTLAKKLDPNDPTAWLYSALLNQQDSQINDAVRDLEKSQSLNDNRSVYRSQLLLDEDRAVRSANLANIYQDAGMFDLSMREAGRAVSADYANYSAHLFLANSYDQLRDPNWSNLRYEPPALSEFWIANLLAPTSAGWLSSGISQQPYAKLFEQNHFGVVSETTYLSRGAWSDRSDQYYTSDRFSYDVGTSYQSDPGQRPNDDFENREVDVSLKGQLTANDSIFGQVLIANVNNGDDSEYYTYNTQFAGSQSFREDQWDQPNLYLGYHHEWSPGMHTLLFASRGTASQSVTANNDPQPIFGVT